MITKKEKELRDFIVHELHSGATIYEAVGAYNMQKRNEIITIVDKGSTYMSSAAGIQAEIADVITGIILLFSACSAFISYLLSRVKDEEGRKDK